MVVDMVTRSHGGSHGSSHGHQSYGDTHRSRGSTSHYRHSYHSSTGGHLYVSPWIIWTLLGLIVAAVIAFLVYRIVKRRRRTAALVDDY